MKINNLLIFAYDFPHKKTQDFILRLLIEGYNISHIIAAPKKELPFAKSSVHIAPKHEGLIHPKKISAYFKIPYLVADHNSTEAVEYIKGNPVDLSIVAGARILSPEVVEATGCKIVNIHPALLPEERGMDPLLWSIYDDVPIGISAHLIGKKIDSGLLICKEELALSADDTIVDVSLRLLEKQTDVLINSLRLLQETEVDTLTNLDFTKSDYNKKMSSDLEQAALGKFPSWLKKYGKEK